MLLGDIDTTFGHVVNLPAFSVGSTGCGGSSYSSYLSFLEFIVERVDLVVESCCADFAGFIEEVDREESARATLVMPFLDLGFVGHTNLDGPSSISNRPWR